MLIAWIVAVGALVAAAPVHWAELEQPLEAAAVALPILVVSLAGGLVGWSSPLRRVRERMMSAPDDYPGEHALRADIDALVLERDGEEVSWSWDQVEGVEIRRNHVMLAVGGERVWIPRRAFGGLQSEERVLSRLSNMRAGTDTGTTVARRPGTVPGPFAPPSG